MQNEYLFFVGTFVGAWFGFGVYNYRRILRMVEHYDTLLKRLDEEKEEAKDMYQEVILFNRREQIIYEFGSLESLRMALSKNERKAKAQLFFSAVILGPLYQL